MEVLRIRHETLVCTVVQPGGPGRRTSRKGPRRAPGYERTISSWARMMSPRKTSFGLRPSPQRLAVGGGRTDGRTGGPALQTALWRTSRPVRCFATRGSHASWTRACTDKQHTAAAVPTRGGVPGPQRARGPSMRHHGEAIVCGMLQQVDHVAHLWARAAVTAPRRNGSAPAPWLTRPPSAPRRS